MCLYWPVPRFMLFTVDAPLWEAMGEAERGVQIKAHADWAARLKAEGRLIQADGLDSDARLIGPFGARTVDYSIDSRAATGFFLFEAADWDEAVSVGEGCPVLAYGGLVEVRRVGH